MATKINHNSDTNHDDGLEQRHELSSVTKQQVVMRRDPNEPREQKERPLSISQRIKQLQMNAGLDKEFLQQSENTRKHTIGTKRQNASRPFTTIGNIK